MTVKTLLIIDANSPGDRATEIIYQQRSSVLYPIIDASPYENFQQKLIAADDVPTKVNTQLDNTAIAYVTASGHGRPTYLMGYAASGGMPEIINKRSDLKKYAKNRIFHFFACNTGYINDKAASGPSLGLGALLVKNGAKAFFGYNLPFKLVIKSQVEFCACDMAIDKALIAGKNAEQAHQAAIDQFNYYIESFRQSGDHVSASNLYYNLGILVSPVTDPRFGDKTATIEGQSSTEVSFPGGLSIANGQKFNFLSARDGSEQGSPFLMYGNITAPPLAFGQYSVFAEGITLGTTLLHTYDVYTNKNSITAPVQMSGGVDATPVEWEKTIYIASNTGMLLAVDYSSITTPLPKNLFNVTNAPGTTNTIGALFLSADKSVIFLISGAGLYAVNLSTSAWANAWSAQKTLAFYAANAFLSRDDTLCAASGKTIYAYSKQGVLSWQQAVSYNVSGLFYSGFNQFMAGGNGDTFQVYNVADGSAKGTINLSISNIDFSKCLLQGNYLYIVTTSGQLYAYKFIFIETQSSYSAQWEQTLTGGIAVAPSFSQSVLYVQDNSNNIYAYNSLTGQVIWQSSTTFSPAISSHYVRLANEGQAVFYELANYAGNAKQVTEDEPNYSGTVASAEMGPNSTYTLFYSNPNYSDAIDEVFQSSNEVSLTASPKSYKNYDLDTLIGLGAPAGVILNKADSSNWLNAIKDNQFEQWFVTDYSNNVFGPNVAMLDFSGSALTLARKVQSIVEIGGSGTSIGSNVEVALAMSGSTAQDIIQSYPGDLDFTQRVNIKAADSYDALSTLGDLVLARAKALTPGSGINVDLVEVKFGRYPYDFQRTGSSTINKDGSPIAWSLADLTAGSISGTRVSNGKAVTIQWSHVEDTPNWIKLDWIFSESSTNTVMNTSNVIDPTWENTSDGTITTLDTQQDAFLQEIYLDTASMPLVQKLFDAIAPQILVDYKEQMALEVKKFATPGSSKYNYGKVAKRLYNLYRENGRYLDGVYTRGVFDEPGALVYQVWSRVKGIGEAAQETNIAKTVISAQTQALITEVSSSSLDAATQTTINGYLNQIKTALDTTPLPSSFSTIVSAAQTAFLTLINSIFNGYLNAVPGIDNYISQLTSTTVSENYVLTKYPRIYETDDDWFKK